eukprot:310699_1
MLRIMSKANPILHRLCRNKMKTLYSHHQTQPPSIHHISINRLSIHTASTHTTTTTTVQTSIRTFSDQKAGSFKQPTKKKRSPKSTETESSEDTPDTPNPMNPVIHSKATYKTMQSSTKTRTVNGKTETFQRKTLSHGTQIKSGDNNVKVSFSQQSEKRSETDHEDPSKDHITSNTQTYKRMDIKSEDVTDSHTEINSVQESLSASDEPTPPPPHAVDYAANTNTNYDIYTVGNPTSEEIEWRRSMMNPHALIIHPDRLLPVPVGEQGAKEKQKGWGYWQRRLRQTFTSVREKIVGNETFNETRQKIMDKHETLSTVYDTSQNYHLVKMRGMIDRLNMQTESSKAMQVIQDEFSDFWVEDFLPSFDELLCPLIVRAFLQDDLEFLDMVCIGEAQVFCKNIIEGRITENKMLAPDILWIHEADLIETKLHNKRPQLVIRTEVQCIDCVYERGTDNVVEGSPSMVVSNIFVMVLEPNVDEEYNKMIPLPWQVRSLTTARQRQIV